MVIVGCGSDGGGGGCDVDDEGCGGSCGIYILEREFYHSETHALKDQASKTFLRGRQKSPFPESAEAIL